MFLKVDNSENEFNMKARLKVEPNALHGKTNMLEGCVTSASHLTQSSSPVQRQLAQLTLMLRLCKSNWLDTEIYWSYCITDW